MALPSSRNTTYGPTSPVKSADLNALQDCVIGRKKPPWTRSFWPVFSMNDAGFSTTVFPPVKWTNTVASGSTIAVACDEGDRITALIFKAFGNGVVDATATLHYFDDATWPNPTTIGTIADNNRAAAWGDVVVPVTPQIIGAGGALELVIAPNAAGYSIGKFKSTFDRL